MKVKAFSAIKTATFSAMAAFGLLAINGCGGSETQLFPPSEFSSELMEDYVRTKASLQDPMPSDISAYIDFSDGVNIAYNTPENKDILRTILNSLSGSNVEYFRLADSKVDTLKGTPDDIFVKATNPKEYLKQKAPIRKALEQIVEAGKPAVLITDFEEYDGNGVHDNAYAKRYFVDWLKADRSITFFAVNYKEKGKDKKLFFTIFDGNPNILIDKITNAMKGCADSYGKFVMSTSNYSVITDYPAANKGGNYHNLEGIDNVTCVQEDISAADRFTLMPEYKTEYYPLGSPYADIIANGCATQNESKPYPPYSYTYFLQNIYFNFSNFAYDDVELDIVVSNAQADYDSYFRYVYAENQRAVHEDGTEDDYIDVHGVNKHPYVPVAMTEVKDIFKLDDEPSENYPNVKKFEGFTEYGLDFDWDKFDGSQINGAELGDLLRVDIVIEDVDDKESEDLEEFFSWGKYNNLSESVRLALQEVRPIGKVVYTFYVRTAY